MELTLEKRINKVIFMGTPEFAVPSLYKLSETRFKPVLVITQPDKPKGRKKKLSPTEVKKVALELDIPVIQPEDVNDSETIARIKEISPDIILTVAYGGYIKKEFRKLPKYGCLNLHPSLLPKYRGAAPINSTLFNGDKEIGNTIFKIVASMDSGPILFQSKSSITKDDNFTTLYNRLSKEGADDFISVLNSLEKDEIVAKKQDHSLATFSSKIEKSDLIINWDDKSENIYNRVRGFSEVPGAFSFFREKRLKIIKVEVLDEVADKKPGTIVDIIKNAGIKIASGDKNMMILEVQPAGKKVMTAHAFNLGARITIGEELIYAV